VISYGWRTLVQSKGRLALAVGGVALALTLIVALDAIFLGVERKTTAYVDHAGADVIVSQSGVRTMHMAASSLPAALVDQVRAMPEVASVTPVLYASDVMRLGETRSSVYVIGLPPDAAAGRPWRIAEGAAIPAPGGVVIDRRVAEGAGVGLGDPVTLLGRSFRIDGLSEGTAVITGGVAVVTLADFAAQQGGDRTVSFVFVRVAPGASPEAVAAGIAAAVDGVTAQTRQGFAAEERDLIRDMGTNIISVMNALGFLVGLAVMALTVYIATLSHRAEFGLLKALGARNGHLYRVVLAQALASVGLGFAVAVALTLALAVLLPRLGSNLALAVGGDALVKALAASLIIAGLSALLPIKQIARLDPAMVFRGR
jgi:putative ABC transport system permease protein